MMRKSVSNQFPPRRHDRLWQFVAGLVTETGIRLNPLDVADHFVDDTQDTDHSGNVVRKPEIGA